MAILSNGITIGPFKNVSSEEDTNWTLKFQRVGNILRIGMHWGNKDQPTHQDLINYDEFIKQIGQI